MQTTPFVTIENLKEEFLPIHEFQTNNLFDFSSLQKASKIFCWCHMIGYSKLTLTRLLKFFCLFSFHSDASGNFAKAIEMLCVESDGKSCDEFGKSHIGTASVV